MLTNSQCSFDIRKLVQIGRPFKICAVKQPLVLGNESGIPGLQKFGDFVFWLTTLIAAGMFVSVAIWSGWTLYEREISSINQVRHSQWIRANSYKLGKVEFEYHRSSLVRADVQLAEANQRYDTAITLSGAVAIVAAFVCSCGFAVRGTTRRPEFTSKLEPTSMRWHQLTEKSVRSAADKRAPT